MSELNVVEPRELTSVERRVLNNVSMEQNANVKLGEIISEILDNVQPGTPVNAEDAAAILRVESISHGETLTIGSDIYEVTAREDAVVAEGHIAIPVYDISTPATGALTMAVQPTAGDTITIGEKTYIFVPNGTDTADGEVSIGVDLTGAQAALVAAVNGTDEFNSQNEDVKMAAFVADVATLEAIVAGVYGNTITTTSTFTSESNLFSGLALINGANCSTTDALIAIADAVTDNDTQGVAAEVHAIEPIVTLSALGEEANAIEVSTTMLNAGFLPADTTSLSGGVNATESDTVRLMVDEDYLYVCTAPNTIDGTNWRRIFLGDPYYSYSEDGGPSNNEMK